MAQAGLGLWRARSVQPGTSIGLEEVLGRSVVTVRSSTVSRETRRWDVLLGRVTRAAGGGHELWGPAAVFHTAAGIRCYPLDKPTSISAAERRVVPQAAFRACAADLLRFTPPSRVAEPSFFTFEGDPITDAHARWELVGDAAVALELHPDLVDTGDTEDGEGICLEWTAARRELAARRPKLPPGALLLESAPVFVDDEGRVSSDGARIGLGTFELRPRELAFYAISAERPDGAVALVAEAIGGQARLVERRGAPLEPSGSGGRASRRTRRSGEPAVPDELGEAIIAGFARDRFLRMLDEPDPRFGGMTPRQAARRAGVERWLRTLENAAARGRAHGTAAPDIAMLRAELGLAGLTAADAACRRSG